MPDLSIVKCIAILVVSLPRHDKKGLAVFGASTLGILLLSYFCPVGGLLYVPAGAIALLCGTFSDLIFFDLLLTLVPVLWGGGAHGLEYFLYILLPGAFLIEFFTGEEKTLYLWKKLTAYASLMILTGTILLFSKNENAGEFGIVLPLLGMLLNLLLSAFIVTGGPGGFFDRESARYDEINDPEYPVLLQIKEKDPAGYALCIHRAVLCEKVGKRMGYDEKLCKCLGYFASGEKLLGCEKQEYLELLKKKGFPDEITGMLEGGTEPMLLLPILSEEIINCVKQRFAVDEEGREKLVDFVFKQQGLAGTFDDCSITVGQLKRLRECYREEQDFYDILC